LSNTNDPCRGLRPHGDVRLVCRLDIPDSKGDSGGAAPTLVEKSLRPIARKVAWRRLRVRSVRRWSNEKRLPVEGKRAAAGPV